MERRQTYPHKVIIRRVKMKEKSSLDFREIEAYVQQYNVKNEHNETSLVIQ